MPPWWLEEGGPIRLLTFGSASSPGVLSLPGKAVDPRCSVRIHEVSFLVSCAPRAPCRGTRVTNTRWGAGSGVQDIGEGGARGCMAVLRGGGALAPSGSGLHSLVVRSSMFCRFFRGCNRAPLRLQGLSKIAPRTHVVLSTG